MSNFKLCFVFAAMAAFAGAASAQDIGRPITEADVAPWDISVAPDGDTLPAGSGDVQTGAELYAAQCAVCHGETGAEGPADQLVGGVGTLASDAPLKTVGSFWPYATTTFDYVRRAMPYFAPGSLSDDDAYAITAYVLHLNGVVGEGATLDANSLQAITMPNAQGFIDMYASDRE
ncbi:MAG: cytochrome c [Alphaproteobacteria bacterium]|nr:cytochrome c [Alphaproteobacteria bacterium]